MKKAVVLGHFGFGHDKSNGQTIKTKIVTNELIKVFGDDQIGREDTMGGWKFLLRLVPTAWRMLRGYKSVIFLPAYKGVRVIVPLLVMMNVFFHRRLHYVVIGGWLPGFVKKYPLLRWALRRVHGIYVETKFMRDDIEAMGFKNLFVMPNFKPLHILDKDCISVNEKETEPFRVCTFSRVMEQKGIADAIAAVELCNKKAGKTLFTLDIYGPVEEPEWFDALMKNRKNVSYGGVVPFGESVNVLKNYFALLFPTLFPTEGFPGTLIDAFSAGVPVIASDVKACREIIEEGKQGFLYPMNDFGALADKMLYAAGHLEQMRTMCASCIEKAAEYQPETIIQTLTGQIE